MIIVRKTNSLAERLFYIRQALANKWSKEVLAARIEDDLFNHQGEIANNFIQKIPDARQSLEAIGMFKDEYLLDFINVEEIGERDKEDINERVIEQEIIHNIKKFILTFDQDFAFVGNQYKLEVYGVKHIHPAGKGGGGTAHHRGGGASQTETCTHQGGEKDCGAEELRRQYCHRSTQRHQLPTGR